MASRVTAPTQHSGMPIKRDDIATAIQNVFDELVFGASSDETWVLNRTDLGLLVSLDRLSAESASVVHNGRSSIAAHIDHLRYGLGLLNAWARGGEPFATADWSASWRRLRVSEEEWADLRQALAHEARDWTQALTARRTWDQFALTSAIASTAHIAYHLAAIRQMDPTLAGPAEAGP